MDTVTAQVFLATHLGDMTLGVHLAARFELPFTMLEQWHNGQPEEALEHVYEQLNTVGSAYAKFLVPEPWAVQYRADRHRSLSVGDVVTLAETAYRCDSYRWERLTSDELLDAISAGRRQVVTA